MRPNSREALTGMAGLLTKQQQYTAAAAAYDQLLKIEPHNADAWRGLFLSYARDGQSEKALAIEARFPPNVKAAMAKDPEYLQTLATIYRSQNRPADAQRVLAQALALPFPDNGTNLKENTRLQYAGILMEAHRFDQAAVLYTQILNDDAGSLPAWMGLVSAHHEMNQDNQAIADVEKMPPSTYEAALTDVGFLSMLGSIYQQANQFDIAQGLLERSAKLQMAAGGQPSLQLQLQLAAIYLQRNNTAQAYEIYRQVLTAHPDRIDAWKGLIATLQATNHNTEALQEIALIPPAVRRQLESDFEFVQGEASLYAAAGDIAHATEYMNRVQTHYAQLRTPPPANIEVQNAWLLYNTKNDRALYPTLMRLGSRHDLTATQRETVQTIWANWSVRRAGTAIDNGDNQRAVEILEAASLAFPDNVTVRKVLAGGYLKVGQTKDALAIYKAIPMQDASAADFQGAIGSALAANDKAQAEVWLRQALERFPADSAILAMAARFEQARGDNQRAADYWRASLAAMPQSSPTDRLAHDLAYPDVNTKPHRATTAADLQHLLDPNYEPFQKTTKLPPLPAYGPDPYSGTAPVVITQPRANAQTSEIITAPTTTEIPVPAASSTLSSALPPPPPQASASGTGASTNWSGTAGTTGNPLPPPEQTTAKSTSSRTRHRKPTSDVTTYSGRANPPTTQENATPTGASSANPAPPATRTPVFIPNPEPVVPASQQPSPPQWTPPPQSSVVPPTSGTKPPLRITSQPMDSKAAEVQARFADQTDGQLTQGSAANIRSLPNAAVTLPSTPAQTPTAYNDVQYTPSAQEAATGAYSAQKQSSDKQPAQTPLTAPASQQASAPDLGTDQKPKKAKRRSGRTERVPTLVTAPNSLPATEPVEGTAQPQAAPEEVPIPSNATTSGLSDEELEQRSLPPLRGPWVRVQRQPQPVGPREEAQMQLETLESGYSPWTGGAGVINYRSGDLGYDHLSALEAPFEVSSPFGYNARITIVAKPVFLDSGQADGTSVITVQEATTSGTTLVTIPQPLGTDLNTGSTTTTTNTTATPTPPPQQNAAGVGGEVQLAFPHLALAAGYTPYGFSDLEHYRPRAVAARQWTLHLQLHSRLGKGHAAFLRGLARSGQRVAQLSGNRLGRRGCQSGQRAVSRAAMRNPASTWELAANISPGPRSRPTPASMDRAAPTGASRPSPSTAT